MEALRYFLLILTVESAFCTRTKLSLHGKTPNDFFELVETSAGDFREFYGELEATYDARRGKNEFSDVAETLASMSKMFLRESVAYVERRLVEFCDLAMRLIGHDHANFREKLGFSDDCVYCIITPTLKSGLGGEEVFEAIFFLRTIHRDDRFPIEKLNATLSLYRESFVDDFLAKNSHEQLSPDPASPDDGKRLLTIKQKIANFSKMFCPWWTPIVSHDFLAKPVADQVRNESSFVRHVHFNEKCKILAGHILYEENKIDEWWDDYPIHVDEWILSWDCSNILETQEYGLEKNKNLKEETVVVPMSPKPEYAVETEFSLAELKEKLQSKPYSMNALKYYHLVWDVMLMASIKEGNKMIRGMTIVIHWSCSAGSNDDTIQTIRELRPKLSAFKAVLDVLFVVLTRHKKPEDVVDNYHQQWIFNRRVKSMMRYLDVRDDISKQEYCDKYPETLWDTYDDAYPANDPIGVLKFRGIYFDEPIFHIRQLHQFSAYSF